MAKANMRPAVAERITITSGHYQVREWNSAREAQLLPWQLSFGAWSGTRTEQCGCYSPKSE